MATERDWDREPVTLLRLCPRNLRRLAQLGVRTVGQLCRLSEDELSERQSWMSADELWDRDYWDGMGVHEIKTRLAEFGLRLRGDRLAEAVDEEAVDDSLDTLGLSLRAAKLLRFHRIGTVSELLGLTTDDLLALTFRETAVRELYWSLAKHGLRLRDGYPRGPEDCSQPAPSALP